MIVDVEIQVTMPSTLVVPADAVLQNGTGNIVFVDLGNGYFEPRPVSTGWRDGDQLEVVDGLKPGERIVVSGSFLLDSETRMKAAANGEAQDAHKDPVCGMDVDESKAKAEGKTVIYEGKTYSFCSEDCKQKFTKDPGKYLKGNRK